MTSKRPQKVRINLISGAVGELLALLNGYNYVGGNPVNRVDPSGMCPLLNEPGLINQADARQCNQLVSALRSWNINVVWDEFSIASLTCLPDTVQAVANQDQLTRQRWTTSEVRAIYNAFRIFNKAHRTFAYFATVAPTYGASFPYNYTWPRQQAITFEKHRYISNNDQASFGIHIYNNGESTVILSGLRWGEANPNMDMQSRSWLALHEFSHVFTKDRISSIDPNYEYAVEVSLPDEIFNTVQPTGSPTQYSTAGAPGSASAFRKEYLIEAVTGTLWNYGYSAVPGYDSGAGGWTGAIGQPQTITVNYGNYTLTNVRNIQGLEGWVLFNIIAPTSNN
ncbi:MAG: hypothetical protein U0694_20550 [Anaerolineae bacterium]